MPKVDAMFNGLTFRQWIENTLSHTKVSDWLIIRDIQSADMLGSIRYGMQAIRAKGVKPDGWLVWPVDHPFVKHQTIDALIDCFHTNPQSVIIPEHQGRKGHPILLPGDLQIPEQDFPNGLKDVISQSGLGKVCVPTEDSGIIANVNTPGDVTYV